MRASMKVNRGQDGARLGIDYTLQIGGAKLRTSDSVFEDVAAGSGSVLLFLQSKS